MKLKDQKTLFDEIIDKIAQLKYKDVGREIKNFCTQHQIPPEIFCDILARNISISYTKEKRTFRFCSGVMHAIYASSNFQVPTFFESVYFAFDRGEYKAKTQPDVSSEELYTRPLIKKLLAEGKAE